MGMSVTGYLSFLCTLRTDAADCRAVVSYILTARKELRGASTLSEWVDAEGLVRCAVLCCVM